MRPAKKCFYEKSKVAVKKWLWWQTKSKILITKILVNLCCLPHVSLRFSTKLTWIVVIKIFAISLPSQWISHLFSQWPSWGPHTISQWGCLCIDTWFHLWWPLWSENWFPEAVTKLKHGIKKRFCWKETTWFLFEVNRWFD